MCIAPTVLAANNTVILMGADGKQHAVSDYIGKGTWTLVNFWGVHCPPCREEVPELVLLHDHYNKTLVSVLGIAIGFPSFGYPDKNEVRAFLKEYMVDFPVLFGDESVATKLGADALEGLPTTLMYTPEGELIAEQTGAVNQQIILDFIKNYNKKHKIRKNTKK
jgi:thiol-disulfide isomerase/thioredoxin